MALKDGSLAAGQSAYDYLATERTSLYPFVAFNTIGDDLLRRIARGGPGALGRRGLEAQLSEDIEALAFVRIPQFPSSRAFGHDPVTSIDEYMARAPKNRADWKIVPVGARPFPAAPRQEPPPSQLATYAWGAALLVGLSGLARFIRRGRKVRGKD
ncbi:MAG: hypothetical protein H7Y06_09470 [Opitutaceae bacterium]|nr:hypothetical protein [Opitutaceae bacterium]